MISGMDHQISTIVLAPSLDVFWTDQLKFTSSRVLHPASTS